MQSLDAWALVVVLAASALSVGCDQPRGCLAGCDGQQGGPPVKSLPPCPALRACPHYLSLEFHETPFGVPGGGYKQGGTVGGIVETSQGPAVSWISESSLGAPLDVGVTLLFTGQAAVIGQLPYTKDFLYAPAFARGSEIDVLMPPDYTTVVPVNVETLDVGAPIPTALDPGDHTYPSELIHNPPAVLGVGQAMAAVTGDPSRLQLLDATLGQQLGGVSLGDFGNPLPLVATCNGLLGGWYTASFAPRLAPFTRFAERAGPFVELDPEYNLPFLVRSSTWDGAEDVVTGRQTILELDSAGNELSTTPVSAFAAVGTDDGLLALEIGGAELYQRGTGKKLATYVTQSDGLCWAAGGLLLALVVDHTVYVVANGATMSCLPWTRVVCGP